MVEYVDENGRSSNDFIEELDSIIETAKASNSSYNFTIICSKSVLEKIEKIEFTDYLQDLDAGIVGGFRGIPVIMIPDEAGSYDDTLFLLPSKGRV